MAETDGKRIRKLAAILAPAEVRVGIGSLQGEDARERIADGQCAHLGGRVAGGVERADQRPMLVPEMRSMGM